MRGGAGRERGRRPRRVRDRSAATRSTLEELIDVDLALPRHQTSSPVFSTRIRDDREESREEWLKTFAGTDEEIQIGYRRRPTRSPAGQSSRPTVPPLLRARPSAGLLLPRVRGHPARGARLGIGVALTEALPSASARAWLPGDRDRLAGDEPPRLPVLAETRVPHDVPPPVPIHSVKIPLLSGSRVAVVNVPDDAVVLRPPPPVETVPEIGAAVRDAVRFPLAGEPLEALVRPGGTATIVRRPSLPADALCTGRPAPGRAVRCRGRARAPGLPSERQTLLVAGGLERRAAGRRERERLGTHELARRFHGRVEVHDVEDPALVEIGTIEGSHCRSTRCCWRATSS